MSRHNYSEDLDPLAFGRWRGRVASAIRGKRGQEFLRELETALVAMPDKRLCRSDIANQETGEVCAVGSVLLKRRLQNGNDRAGAIKEIAEKFPEGCEAEEFCSELNISEVLAKEVTFINDEYGNDRRTSEQRYSDVLHWVRSQIR